MWDECKFYDPEFVDHEMKERQRAAGVVDVFPQGGDKGGQKGGEKGGQKGGEKGGQKGGASACACSIRHKEMYFLYSALYLVFRGTVPAL